MKDNDKKLIAVLCSMVVLLFVVIVLAAGVYKEGSGSTEIKYIQGTTSASAVQNAQTTENSAPVNNQTGTPEVNNTTSANNSQQSVQTQTPSNSQNANQTQQTVNVSAMTNQELLDTLAAAVNKTKAYKGAVTVNHTESFVADVTECTGGSIVKSVANTIIGMVIDPTDEVLSFSNGTAIDSDGETSYILLPQEGSFTLALSGVSSISGSMNGNNTVIKATIVPETVGLYDVPKANASALGYLNINNFDTSVLEITSATINYTGSTIEVHIRPDGYVGYAKYTLPMHAEGAAKAAGISGSATFEGVQTEIWQFNW